jgi:PadR family transcriptional regulator, regulatory protein PadR
MTRGQHPRHHGRRGPRSRNRIYTDREGWQVQARVERFVEPALLLLLSEGSTHGYDLADQLAELMDVERVDYGNLYRLLREAESEGIVTSTWNDQLPGRTKRTYDLTPLGEQLLEAWVLSLRIANESIASFVERYDERNT